MTVDIVAVDDARRGRRRRPRRATPKTTPRDARDDRIAARDERDETTLESPPETNVFETNAAPRSRWQTREAKEEEWGVGPSAATAAMAAATSMTSMTSETSSSSETFARLRAGDREGKTIRFPSLPPASVSWVSDAEGALAARDAIFGDGSRPAAREPTLDEIRVVGLDAEWRPQTGSPVALLQLATRDRAFLVDALAMASEDAADEDVAALDALLSDVVSDATILKIGFGFAHDLARLRRSYPRLAATRDATPTRVVDARAVAIVAFPEKRKLAKSGLAVVVASVLGAYVDKTEQCSDWQRRPLTRAQLAYAAADAHCLTVVFDRCACAAPDAIAAALADPDPNLLAEPPASAEAKVADTRRRRRRRRRKRSIGRRPVRR